MDITAVTLAVVALLLGVALGAVAAWLVAGSRTRADAAQQQATGSVELTRLTATAAEARAEALSARSDVAAAQADARAEAERGRAAVADAQREAADARAEAAETASRLAAVTERARAAEAAAQNALERAKQIAEDRDSLAKEFKLLSAQTLDKQGKDVEARAAQRVAETEKLLAPVTEALARFQERLAEVEKDRTTMSATLKTQMESMVTANAELRQETRALANALRKPQARGAWGETQLRRIAEISGMVPYCDFNEQVTGTTADGAKQRPDMRVDMGDGRSIYVDSKVPLSSFLDAMDARDDATRAALESSYARQVKQHVDKLGAKSYWDLETGLPHPDHVVLFLPGEGFLLAALENEPGLYQYGIEHGVLIATPNTLIAMLHTVAHTWRQQELAAEAAHVLDVSAKLYDRIGAVADHVTKLGRSLGSTVDAYNSFVGSMDSRLLPTARELKQLKVGKKDVADVSPVDKEVRRPKAPELQRRTDAELLSRPEPDAEELVRADADALTGTLLELPRQA